MPSQPSSPTSQLGRSDFVYRGVALDAPYLDQLSASFRDLCKGAQQPQVWALGALRSVANSYKKTVLGPWWITVSMCFFVFGLAYLRISISGSGRTFSDAVAIVGTGFLAFSFTAGAVTSSANSFASPQGVQATSALPLSCSIFRAITANVLDFAHESIVVVLLVAAFGVRPSWRWIEVVPAVFLVMLFHFGLLLWLGPLVCRYRDVGPIVGMIQRISIFLSPIFWSVEQLRGSGRLELARWNPYTYFITAFREPLLGATHEVSLLYNPLLVSLGIAIANVILGLLVFGYSYPRLTYWATAA